MGNVLRIAPSDVLKAEEEVRLQERRNKEKLEDLEVKLLPVNYAAVQDTEGLVKRLLSARGTVNLDKRTNTLIIKDISSFVQLCEVQVLTHGGGGGYVRLPKEASEHTVKGTLDYITSYGTKGPGEEEFSAFMRLMDQKDPSFRD